ncbi:MAG TPA: sulfurtransferase [Bacillota bacterium]|nr:sulfurtransferase [Bacillota bacterium]
MSNLVSMEWLKEHLSDPHLVIVDCRFVLGNPEVGYRSYLSDHIPGSFYFDLEKDLSNPKSKHGGRHPLPNVTEWIRKLGEVGINQTKRVVAYDDQGGAMASRFWWLLKYLGHPQVCILNESYSSWRAKELPVTSEVPHCEPAQFTPRIQQDRVVDMEVVKQKKDEPGTILIDSREDKRFKGLEEMIDPVAGHIPGAVNYFWKGVLNEDGTWKSAQQLKEWFAQVDYDKEIIVYCGSGVTACPNILALEEAGYKEIKLYAGSWSDWCSYSENPIATDK